MSFFSRALQFIRRPTRFVGKDLEGNNFYEYPATTNDPRRTRRVVRYKEGRDMLHYATGTQNLAVQWKSWLSHTRRHPPTLAELQADSERQQRVARMAAAIEASDRAQQEQMRIATVAAHDAAIPAPNANPTEEINPKSFAEPQLLSRQDGSLEDPGPWHPRADSDEPQAWQPNAIRRRG